jgi:protein gp37
MNTTKINWCDVSWNPFSGCTKIAQGCKNCYAEKLHTMRHKAFLEGKKLPQQYAKPFSEIQFFPKRLSDPKLKNKKPLRIFVNSMSDIFHNNITDGQINQVFEVIEKHQQHTFMILTKRINRAVEWSFQDTPNLWLGFSASTQKEYNENIDWLLESNAKIKWVSIEPQLEKINILKWGHVQWVVCGCESGTNRRPFDNSWALGIAEYSKDGLPVWIKQIRDKENKVIEDIDLFPNELRIRELPNV